MKITGFGAAPARVSAGAQDPVDVTRCTRCGEPWGYEIVERVEIWSCSHCGYEARERSTDHAAMLDATHDSMIS